MTAVCLAGGTGLIGSNMLSVLSNHPSISSIHAFSRKDFSSPSSKLHPITSSDSSSWPKSFPAEVPVFLSALGTTRGQAGSFANQRKIDYDLNLDLARAAKAAGTKVYVLISSGGADAASSFPYMKMKGEVEEAVKALDFERTVIVRPGLIVGSRADSRPPEFVLQKLAGFMGGISGGRLKDFWAQDADVIAKAAVKAGLEALEGRDEGKVRIVSQSDVVRMGRTEWKD